MVKCYHCGKLIEDEWDLVEKKIPLTIKTGQTRNYRRKFHAKCVRPFMEEYNPDGEHRLQETSDWDKCAQYFMKICGFEKIPKYAVNRLLGLYNGSYTQRGMNTRGSHRRGYSYMEIYNTLVFCTIPIQSAVSTVNFKDMEHMINYVIKIVWNNIDEVSRRMKEQEKTNKALEKVDLENDKPIAEYKRKGGRLSSTSNLAKLIEDNETDEIDELFGG